MLSSELRALLPDNKALSKKLEALSLCTFHVLNPEQWEITKIVTWVLHGGIVSAAHPKQIRDMLAYMRLLVREGYKHGGTGWLKYCPDSVQNMPDSTGRCPAPTGHHRPQGPATTGPHRTVSRTCRTPPDTVRPRLDTTGHKVRTPPDSVQNMPDTTGHCSSPHLTQSPATTGQCPQHAGHHRTLSSPNWTPPDTRSAPHRTVSSIFRKNAGRLAHWDHLDPSLLTIVANQGYAPRPPLLSRAGSRSPGLRTGPTGLPEANIPINKKHTPLPQGQAASAI